MLSPLDNLSQADLLTRARLYQSVITLLATALGHELRLDCNDVMQAAIWGTLGDLEILGDEHLKLIDRKFEEMLTPPMREQQDMHTPIPSTIVHRHGAKETWTKQNATQSLADTLSNAGDALLGVGPSPLFSCVLSRISLDKASEVGVIFACCYERLGDRPDLLNYIRKTITTIKQWPTNS